MYFLNINKPKGISSFDVIRELRKRLKIKQIGHSGTLDPLASGVMQVAVGKATKLLDFLDSDKEYIADIVEIVENSSVVFMNSGDNTLSLAFLLNKNKSYSKLYEVVNKK